MRINRRTLLSGGALFSLAGLGTWQDLEASYRLSTGTPVPATPTGQAEPVKDGYELWLRYRPVTDQNLRDQYRAATQSLVSFAGKPIGESIAAELDRACEGMVGQRPVKTSSSGSGGAILVGTPQSSDMIRNAVDSARLASLGDEAFALKSTTSAIVISANTDRGLLYGMFAFIRQMQLHLPIDQLDLIDTPGAILRMVDHWDNLDRTVERGYAGLSIFQFADLTAPNPRYEDYARLLASVGINSAVINNVNADPAFLQSSMMPGYAKLAAVLRNWGIRLFLSANFAAPIDLTANDAHPIGTADPLDKGVEQWWASKVDEIYQSVPDFGGFLVKANSEGEPGPLTYNRTHAQGANMLAKSLEKHGGLVIWRTFTHHGFTGWSEDEFKTFQPLDGTFAPNVMLQTKNGPIDFQVIEPVNPLFGAMPRTNQMIELQITQEYTGHATHLCYLPVYWAELLGFTTHLDAENPTVADIVTDPAGQGTPTGFAGVINFGDDRNWTGSYLAAANMHGFARLAWNPLRSVQEIATEWTALTFGPHQQITSLVVPILLASWDTYRRYASSLGSGYLVRPLGPHFMPDPESTQGLTHHTDSHGSGYDRTVATGSGFTRFYSDYWFDRYEHLKTCPEDLLMFMHIVPWDHKLSNGKTAIQQVYDEPFAGSSDVQAIQGAWRTLEKLIDHDRFSAISRQFGRQLLQSQIWRDVLVSYYFTVSRIVSATNPWIQLDAPETPPLLLGGVENDMVLQLTNATAKSESLKVAIDGSMDGWTSTTVKKALKSAETGRSPIKLTPPLEPSIGAVRFSCDPSSLTQIGFATQLMTVTPDASHCVFAIDIGAKPKDVVKSYASLTSDDLWQDGSTVGWVDKAPRDVWSGAAWGPLLDHFASDSAARTLRLSIPAGHQRAWMLVGGEGAGTQPITAKLGKTILVDTGYLEEGEFQWAPFALDGGKNGATLDLTFEGRDGRNWRLGALVVLKPGA